MDLTVHNQGPFKVVASQTYEVGVYLSADGSWDTADRLIHAETVDSVLPSGSSDSLYLPVVIPGNMAEGIYHVIVKVDNANEIVEMGVLNSWVILFSKSFFSSVIFFCCINILTVL